MYSTTSKFRRSAGCPRSCIITTCRQSAGFLDSASCEIINDLASELTPALHHWIRTRAPHARQNWSLFLWHISTSKDSAQPTPRNVIRPTQRPVEKHKPDTAAVEKLFFQSNVKTALAVGQARGVIMLCLQKAGIEHLNTPPTKSSKPSLVTAGQIKDKCRIWCAHCFNWKNSKTR